MFVRIGTFPTWVILVATSSGKRVFRWIDRLMHRSAWNMNSRKFVWPRSATYERPRLRSDPKAYCYAFLVIPLSNGDQCGLISHLFLSSTETVTKGFSSEEKGRFRVPGAW